VGLARGRRRGGGAALKKKKVEEEGAGRRGVKEKEKKIEEVKKLGQPNQTNPISFFFSFFNKIYIYFF
jgi:hypothetical protein